MNCYKNFLYIDIELRKRRPIAFSGKRRTFYANRYTKSTDSRTKSNDVSQSAPEIKDVTTPSARKVKFPHLKSEAKLKQIPFAIDEDNTRMQTVSNLEGNLLITTSVLQEALAEIALCRCCQIGKLILHNNGSIRAGSAMYLLMRCEGCYSSKTFWYVSGKFNSKIQIGEQTIPKRNNLIYSSILGGDDLWGWA